MTEQLNILPVGIEFIKLFSHSHNKHYCKICSHPAEWHSSTEDHWCQICRFENADNHHSLEVRSVERYDVPWQDYLENITGFDYRTKQGKCLP